MSPKKETTTDLAPVNTTTLDLALPPDLAEELGELNALGELGREDRPLPVLAFNMKAKDETGAWLPKDIFYNTATEETVDDVECVLITVKKTRRNANYVEGQGTEILCRSDDLKIGIDIDGKQIECATCPKKNWLRNEKPQCGLVYNFVGLDLRTGQPFVVRAKGASLPPTRKYIAKYFTSKLRLQSGQFADLPLFVYHTKLSLDTPEGTYAVLRMENIGACSKEEILQFKGLYETFQNFRQVDLDSEQPASRDDGEKDDDLPDFLEE